MIQFSIRLPEDMYEAIKNLAEKERRSLNSQLVKMLEDEVGEIKEPVHANHDH